MAGKELPTIEELKEMAEVDIHTVDKESLVPIENVQIHAELPDKERLEDYIRQIKNPYCYLSNGVVVKISFARKGHIGGLSRQMYRGRKEIIKMKKW